jgi:hypothetical protein
VAFDVATFLLKILTPRKRLTHFGVKHGEAILVALDHAGSTSPSRMKRRKELNHQRLPERVVANPSLP